MRFHKPLPVSRPREEWHPWFAWHFVRIGDELVIFETIERKGTYTEATCMLPQDDSYWTWEYRDVGQAASVAE